MVRFKPIVVLFVLLVILALVQGGSDEPRETSVSGDIILMFSLCSAYSLYEMTHYTPATICFVVAYHSLVVVSAVYGSNPCRILGILYRLCLHSLVSS